MQTEINRERINLCKVDNNNCDILVRYVVCSDDITALL